MIIKGEVNNLTWWSHYITMSDASLTLEPNFEDSNFWHSPKSTQDVLKRKIRPIKPSNLYDQDVFLYGGSVKFWE
jgi:hypothetical protein